MAPFMIRRGVCAISSFALICLYKSHIMTNYWQDGGHNTWFDTCNAMSRFWGARIIFIATKMFKIKRTRILNKWLK